MTKTDSIDSQPRGGHMVEEMLRPRRSSSSRAIQSNHQRHETDTFSVEGGAAAADRWTIRRNGSNIELQGGDSSPAAGKVSISTSRRRRMGTSYRYSSAGILLSIAVVAVAMVVNGPQSVSAGFACLSNPCVFGVCVDDLNR